MAINKYLFQRSNLSAELGIVSSFEAIKSVFGFGSGSNILQSLLERGHSQMRSFTTAWHLFPE